MRRLLLLMMVLGALLIVAGPQYLGVDPLGTPAWWLTHRMPPEVRIEAPAGPVRGSVPLRITGSDHERADVIEVRVDDVPIPPGWTVTVDTQGLADGPHR